MLDYTPIDYAQAYFPELVFPKISGILTFENLKTIKIPSKAMLRVFILIWGEKFMATLV